MRGFIMDGKFPYNCDECNGSDLRNNDYHSTIIEFIICLDLFFYFINNGLQIS